MVRGLQFNWTPAEPRAAWPAGRKANAIRDRDKRVSQRATETALGKLICDEDFRREFYENSIREASPSPSLVGEPLVSGARVAVEISITLSGASSIHAVDLFVVEDGLIRSLTYFLADH